MDHTLLTRCAALALSWAVMPARAEPPCEASSPAQAPTVVELYTSEGCNSCPPADRWFSTLPTGPALVALAFHVDYWDSLGWKDRFASHVHTQRQMQWQAALGARSIYTPQVVLNGADWRGQPGPLPARTTAGTAPASLPSLRLQRHGGQVSADVLPPATPPGPDLRYTGYWAVLEDGHQSQVKAGENTGVLLRHDHVVQRYQPLPSWPAARPQHFSWPDLPEAAGHTRQVVLVVETLLPRVPVQAVVLQCPRGG